MNKLFDGVLAVLVVLVMSGLLVWVIISIADGIAKDEDSYSFTSTHQGHYKNGKREGKWSINNNYRIIKELSEKKFALTIILLLIKFLMNGEI